jgi:hypothetical protein
MLPPDGRYLFGRVIRTRLERAPMPGAHLIYIYRHRSDGKQADRKELAQSSLLLPPLFINRLPWSKGYFETVAHWPLEPGEVVPQQSFWSVARGRYLDQDGNVLEGPIEPVGEWGLHSYRTLDDAVCDALGIERAPA